MSQTELISLCPYMVSLKQRIRGRLKICGGTVLTQTLTLSAAHCILDGIIGLYLQFGTPYLFGGFQFASTSILIHEKFNSINLTHDIGIVSIFPERIYFGSQIQPVKLPDRDIELNSESKLRIYGWGAVSTAKSFSTTLQTALLPLIDKDKCQRMLDGPVPENTFCLGYLDGRVDSCLGDSGGPAMLGDIQLGIISFGEGCAQPFKPGVYTDLRKYPDWISEAIETID